MRPSGSLANRRPARLGLRARLSFSFLIVVVPALVLLLAGSCRHYRDRRAAALERNRLLARTAAALTDSVLQRLSEDTRLALKVAATGNQAITATLHLQKILAADPLLLNAFLLDGQGRAQAIAPAGQQVSLDPTLLARAQVVGAPAVSDLLPAAPDGRPAIQILVPGVDPAGEPAIAGVTVDARVFAAPLQTAAAGTGELLALCDRRGWVIQATPSGDLPWSARDWSEHAVVRQALGGMETAFDGPAPMGSAGLTAAVPLPLGWVAIASEPSSDLGSWLDAPTLIGLAALLGLAVLGAVTAAQASRHIGAPIKRLAEHARSLGRGQLNERLDVGGDDELAELAAALNAMAAQTEERDRRLRARTAELDAIITQSADGIAIHGAEGELQRLNPAGIRILGRPPGRVNLPLAEQANWFRMRSLSGAPLSPGELPVAAALRGETRLNQELCVQAESGQTRYLSFSASPLSDARGRIYGAVVIFRDMTQSHQAQQEKDDFISLVSHELKTPITSIKGYAQMLQRRAEEAGGNERDLKGLRIINDEVDRMVDLINQLLDVSRLETQRLQLSVDVVDLVALTRDAVDRLQMTTSRHTLRLRAPEEPIPVQADPMRIAQVLGNLIMNAIKYSPGGGPVEIALERQQGRGWVSVRDWGIGIAPEDQPHIFQRFFRGTRRPGTALTGMGLGLYISREIVQRHHGDIVFHSQPGQGSTFLFWLPLAVPAADEEPEPGAEPHLQVRRMG
ncbi:MAG: ATP-binding protein [Anaerolineae bacterium]